MSLTRLVLRFAAPIPDLLSFERYLFIGPHPDDIEIGAGATAARLAAMGKKVTFLICTDGRFGLDNAPEGTKPPELIGIRRKEALASAKLLGAEAVRFLNFPDGGGYDPDLLLRQLAWEVGRLKPQVIFAPDPSPSSECHPDHLRAGEAARQLAFSSPNQELMACYGADSAQVEAIAFYMTARPNRFVRCAGYMKKQAEAIACHRSQFPSGCKAEKDLRLYLRLRAADFGLRSFSGQAEGFRVLGRTHMHCLPEAGR